MLHKDEQGGGLLHTDKQEKGFRAKSWSKDTGLANLSRSRLCKEAGHKNLREDRYGGHFLHILSTPPHGSEKGFVIPLSITS